MTSMIDGLAVMYDFANDEGPKVAYLSQSAAPCHPNLLYWCKTNALNLLP